MGPGSGAGLLRCAAVFLPGEVPRQGRVAFWRDDGGELPEQGEPEELTVVRPHGKGVRQRTVPARRLPVRAALPVLMRARTDGGAHPAAACWGAAALHGLRLVARGRLVPGLGEGDVDVWRAGPLDPEDMAQLRAVAAAMPPEAHAVPVPREPADSGGRAAGEPLRVPDPEALVRDFLDAVADVLPRTPAGSAVAGPAFADAGRQRLTEQYPRLREWAGEVAAGTDAGIRVSLRLDLSADRIFDGGPEPEDPEDRLPDADREGTDGWLAPERLAPEQSGQERTAPEQPGPQRTDPEQPGPEQPGPQQPGPERTGTAAEPYVAAAVVQATSVADPALVADVAALWHGEAEHLGPRARVDTVLAVRRAARAWPPLERLLERPAPDVLPLTETELNDLLGRAARDLAAAEVAVHWPRALARELLSATAVVRPGPQAPGSAADGFGFFKEQQLLEFRWQLALDGDPLTEAEMDELAEAHRPLVRLRDQWVQVDPELVRKARKRHLGLLSPGDALAAALSGEAEVDGEQVEAVPVGALAALRDTLRTATDPDRAAVAAPARLHARLRDYQRQGLGWLESMTSLGLGGCLADDMGLGKTVTLIALHLRRAERGATAPTLVVCPASLLGNWQRELARFAPDVPVRRYHGPGRTLEGLERGGPGAAAGPESDAGFVLTTYGTLRGSAEQLAGQAWGLVVADEAQHVKNAGSATARALRTLPAAARIALTGTPVENNLSELWALLDWTTPGLLGPLKTFRARHARAVEGGEDPEATQRLARLVRPFLLRRRKSDPGIVPELPPKTETDHTVELSREQASLYEAVVRETLARIAEATGMERRGLVMKLLTALKQICNHPAQYLREGPGGRLPGRSGKLGLLDELLGTILAEGGSVLVFTQYVEMARLLRAHLADRRVAAQLLHGGTPVGRREELVDAFQSGAVPVFLLSLRAAGTGLNLTRAGHVVHFDRWWNPAVEEQATDRAYRIGQTQPVQVHRLLTRGTVEDRIARLLTAKQRLADAVLSGGEAALTELTDAELADLVALRRQP
ncbi:DEAD/DEAH box helicase [Streptomyces qinglanensis]|uniref:Superfamily II DNA or RNA helicase, SNF2 family n=1 Tax=Streptomyces qinglanensis TaxID=943816 RepID=A0A1H9N6K0_9ACTN|nr:DEAD/DEAH box helicase [Streptomyces qinglanensis]SER31528.1 Superfamily II DNA or RNA helicase, SNF2 family [Streptomyces qinglanensis]